MSWNIEIKPSVEKSYLKLHRKTRAKIKKTLSELEKSDNPLINFKVKPLVMNPKDC